MKKLLIFLGLILFFLPSFGQVSSYSFTQSTSTYTEIAGGTQLGNESTNDQRFVDPAALVGGTILTGTGFPIGFDFVFNGNTYDRFGVNPNGWIALGKSTATPSVDLASTSSYTPLSSVQTLFNDVLKSRISAFSRDLSAQVGSTLRFELIGTAPNRTLVVQWKNYRKNFATGDSYNFQIRLNETLNTIDLVYGSCVNNATSTTFQVGLRAAPSNVATNFVNRVSASSWLTSNGGTLANEVMAATDTNMPTSGLTFTYTPPTCPSPTNYFSSNITNNSATINWDAITSASSGYEYVVSTSNVLPIGSGTVTLSNSVVLNGLLSNTNYYVFVRSNCGSNYGQWFQSGSFKTLCDYVTDFVQNFDTTPTGTNILPDCWSKAGTAASTIYNTTGGALPGTPPNRLYINVGINSYGYVILPPVSNLQANTNRLKFEAYTTGLNKTMELGYFTNPQDTNTFVSLTSFAIPQSTDASTAATFEYAPTTIPVGINQLVLYIPVSTTSTFIYVDDVKWEAVTTCLEPTNIAPSLITNTSIQLAWQENNAASLWDIQYGPVNFSLGSGTVLSNVSTNPITISSLTADTNYHFYVKSKCASDSPWSNPILVKTLCNSVSDFIEKFDSYPHGTSNPLPTCWDKGGVLSGSYIANGGVSPNSAPNRLALSASTPANATYAAMPIVNNLQAETHRLRFKVHTTSGAQRILQIGYLPIAADPTSFVLIEEIEVPNGAAATQEFQVIVSALPAGIQRLAFKNSGFLTGSSLIYIDDVRWELNTNCEMPIALTISNVLDTSAKLNLVDSPSLPTDGYAYFLSTSNIEPTFDQTPTGIVPFGTTFAQLNGLIPGTNYYVWLRALCSASSKSYWTDATIFKTLCSPTTTFSENFDTYLTGAANPLPLCWDKGGTVSNVYITNGSVSPATAPNRLYMAGYPTLTPPAYTYAAMPYTSNLQLGTHRLRFKAYTSSGADRILKVGYLTDAYNVDSFVWITDIALPNGAASITEFTIQPGVLPNDAVRLSFKNDGNLVIPTLAYIEDVIWEPIPTCLEPTNLSLVSTTTASATISWNIPTVLPSNGFDYYVATSNTVPLPTVTPTGNVSNAFNQAVLNGLSAATNYYVWVRSNCGSENSSWAGPIAFITQCNMVTTLNEGFSSAIVPNLPTCWSKILRGTGLSQYAYVNTSNSNTSSYPNFTVTNYVQMNAQASASTADLILVSPPLSNVGAGTNRLKFNTFSQGSIQVGTLDSNNPDTAVFQVLETITLNGSGGSVLVNFNTYLGSNTYIGIRLVPDPNILPSINIDNVIWEPIPSCPEVLQVQTSAPTINGGTVSWANGGSETNWEIVAGLSTVTDPNTLSPIAASTNPYVLNTLNPGTVYNVWVRSICGTNIGAWTGPVTLITSCLPSNVPYSENFEASVLPNMPICTIAENNGSGNIWDVVSDAASFGFNNKALRYFYSTVFDANTWFFTNGVNLTQGQSYTIAFKKGSSSISAVKINNLKVSIGSAQSSASMTNVLATYYEYFGAATNEVLTFTVPTTGVYYFGFHAYSTYNMGSIYVDDIVIDSALSTNDYADENEAILFPNPTNGIVNVSTKEVIDQVIVLDLLGRELQNVNSNTNLVEIDLSNYTSGNYILKVVSKNKVSSFKVIKK